MYREIRLTQYMCLCWKAMGWPIWLWRDAGMQGCVEFKFELLGQAACIAAQHPRGDRVGDAFMRDGPALR
jgi:hypothetical protein